MDISGTYIKMCEKAKEIQNKRLQHTNWDCDIENHYPHLAVDDEHDYWWREATKDVWLPRQDQLQEMVFPNMPYYQKLGLIYEAFKEGLAFNKDWILFPGSMEQLWLAFTMKQLYHKTWNSESWTLA